MLIELSTCMLARKNIHVRVHRAGMMYGTTSARGRQVQVQVQIKEDRKTTEVSIGPTPRPQTATWPQRDMQSVYTLQGTALQSLSHHIIDHHQT